MLLGRAVMWMAPPSLLRDNPNVRPGGSGQSDFCESTIDGCVACGYFRLCPSPEGILFCEVFHDCGNT
jgi:hypothetical protein